NRIAAAVEGREAGVELVDARGGDADLEVYEGRVAGQRMVVAVVVVVRQHLQETRSPEVYRRVGTRVLRGDDSPALAGAARRPRRVVFRLDEDLPTRFRELGT